MSRLKQADSGSLPSKPLLLRHAQSCGAAILIAYAALARPSAAPQSPSPPAAAAWTAPRAADGHPDLSGLWENNSATPLERPAQLAGKPLLSESEFESLKRRAREQFTPESDAVFSYAIYLSLISGTPAGKLGDTGSYSQNWLPNRFFERRTSLIVDPPDGRLPKATSEGQKARAAGALRFFQTVGSAQEMTLTDRCISYGFPDLFAAYMSVYRIVQTRETVAIQMEKIHDSRIVPLDGRPHASPVLRQYLGDSRGQWEGDTLVVETTNFHPNGNPFGGYVTLSDANLHLIERFHRTAPETLEYTFTVDDPTMWTRPWTAVINWQRAKGNLFEYACHEGNYSLPSMLSASRAAVVR